jgi:hypothetical protein
MHPFLIKGFSRALLGFGTHRNGAGRIMALLEFSRALLVLSLELSRQGSQWDAPSLVQVHVCWTSPGWCPRLVQRSSQLSPHHPE